MTLGDAMYAGLVLVLAYLVRGIAGFGSGLIAVPLLALRFPVTMAVPLLVFLDYVGSASQGIRNRGHIAWREQFPLIPFTFVGVGLGLFVLKSVNATILAKALGGFIIVYAVYQWLPLPPLHGSHVFIVPCGILGGCVGTLFGTGGPFYVIYFTLRGLEKTAFRATFAMNFLIDGAIRLVAYFLIGLYSQQMLICLLAALPVAGAGLYLGGRIHTGFTPAAFVRLITLLLLGSGVALLLKH
jgi:uncharacterized membrane protein YfcA